MIVLTGATGQNGGEIARQLAAGVPFGGYKASGFGRECGPEVLDSYTQTKSVWISLA